MATALEHLDVVRALRRAPETLEGFEPAVRSLIQSLARDRARALRRNLLEAEDLRRVSAAVGELLQDVEDRA